MARTKVGRKIVRFGRRVGHKFMSNRGRIGRKLAKAGRITGRIAPFLAAVPGIGPELSLGAAALSSAAQAAGQGLGARKLGEVRKAGASLAETYAAHKAARRR